MGSTLAVVNSQEKQNAIAARLNDDRPYWIGLYRDPQDTSRWLWTDGSRLAYWDEGEPNNDNGDFEGCGEMRPERSGLWNDKECAMRRHYVCEKNGWFNSLIR